MFINLIDLLIDFHKDRLSILIKHFIVIFYGHDYTALQTWTVISGHKDVVRFLVEACRVDPMPKDRLALLYLFTTSTQNRKYYVWLPFLKLFNSLMNSRGSSVCVAAFY